ncbi:relaxase/mobilization nuclease domain-containing protein [Acetobacter persici]|uniref:relaxase/mobilization nuclease domain-containing protein n=1 Tax=Acetobacter persici TaxID=1076596 RepID=UPI0036D84FF6
MIIKSTNITTSSKSRAIVHHLIGKVDENDSIEVLWGNRGDVDDAFTNAELSNKKYGVKHFIISNLEEMTDEQMLEAIDEVGKEFGFTRKNVKMAVIHGKDHHHADGRHLHFLVETINPENGRNFDFKNYQQRQELVSRKMEIMNGFQLNKGRHNRYVFSRLEQENPEYAERMKHLTEGRLERKTISEKQIENLRRRGSTPFQMKKELKDLWASSDNDFDKFAEQLSGAGYSIEQGRKTLIINDRDGKFITGVKNVLNVNDKELSTILEASEYSKKTIASHGMQAPEGADIPSGGITSKTSEHTPSEAQEQTTQPQQTAPDQPQISNTETSQEVRSEATDGMTAEQKLAVSEFNRQLSEKEKLSKEELSNQEKRIKDFLKNMSTNNKPKLQPKTWDDIIENREKSLLNIIDKPHPELKSLTQKETRDFLYNNFKNELDKFYNDRKEYMKLRKEIKELQQKDKWYHFIDKSKLSKKEKEQQEKIKKLMLMASYLVHCMMNKVGLNNIKPNPYDYLTEDEKKEYELQYKKDELAKKLLENNDRAKCLDSISILKVYENDAELMKWTNRDEVRNAKLALSKLNDVRDINILTLDERGQKEFREAQEELNLEKARKAVIEAHKREENRYLADVRPEQEIQEQNQDNEQEKNNSNVVQFPKNNKKKSFSYGR